MHDAGMHVAWRIRATAGLRVCERHRNVYNSARATLRRRRACASRVSPGVITLVLQAVLTFLCYAWAFCVRTLSECMRAALQRGLGCVAVGCHLAAWQCRRAPRGAPQQPLPNSGGARNAAHDVAVAPAACVSLSPTSWAKRARRRSEPAMQGATPNRPPPPTRIHNAGARRRLAFGDDDQASAGEPVYDASNPDHGLVQLIRSCCQKSPTATAAGAATHHQSRCGSTSGWER